MAVWLTTVDNPFNPFTHPEEWKTWDHSNGYYSAEFIARIANYSNVQTEADIELAIEQAIDEIVRENVTGMWRKVTDD